MNTLTPKTNRSLSTTQELSFRYPGSRPFKIGEENKFFGRDDDIDHLKNLIERDKLIVIHSKSGLGKSSLINAGVIPVLKQKPLSLKKLDKLNLPKSEKNKYTPFIKIRFNDARTNPKQSVIKSLLPFLNKDDLFFPEDPTIWDCIKAINFKMANTPILIMDQFEELFNYHSDEQRKQFVAEFADAINDNMPYAIREKIGSLLNDDDDFLDDDLQKVKNAEKLMRLKVIIAIRSDRLSLIDELSNKIPIILSNRYKLQPLTKEQARQAIKIPAELIGNFQSQPFSYEAELVDRIIDFLGKEKIGKKYIETNNIEAFQLQLICQYIEHQLIDFKNKGKVSDKALSSLLPTEEHMKKVLKDFYEMTINDASIVPVNEKNNVKILFEDGLIIQDFRNILNIYDIQERFRVSESTVWNLVNKHLLRHEKRNGQDFYEISHDTLLEPIREARAKREKGKLDALEGENKELKDRNQRQLKWILASALIVLIMSFGTIKIFNQQKAISETAEQLETTNKALNSTVGELEKKNKELLASQQSKRVLQTTLDGSDYALQMVDFANRKKNSDNTLAFRILEGLYKDQDTTLKTYAEASYINMLLKENIFPFYNKVHGWLGEEVTAIAVSNKGRGMIVNGSINGTIEVWPISKDRIKLNKGDNKAEYGPVLHIGIINDMKSLIAASKKQLFIYDIYNKSEKSIPYLDAKLQNSLIASNEDEFDEDEITITSLAVSANEKEFAVGISSGQIFIFNQEGEKLKEINTGNISITDLVYYKNETLIVANQNKQIQLVHRNNLNKSELIDESNNIPVQLVTHPDGLLAAAYSNGYVKIWKKTNQDLNKSTSTSAGQKKKTWALINSFKAHNHEISDIQFSNNGLLVATSSDREACLWGRDGQCLKYFKGHQAAVNGVAFHPKDDNKLFTISSDKFMKEWEIKEFYETKFTKHNSPIEAAIFVPGTNRKMISSSSVGNFYFSDHKNNITLSKNTDFKVYDIQPVNNNFFIIAGDSKVALFNKSNKSIKPLRWGINGTFKEVEELDDWVFAATNSNGRIYVFGEGVDKFAILAFKGGATALDFASERKLLVAGGAENYALMWKWSTSTKELIPFDTLRGHEDYINSTAIDKAGKVIITGSRNNTVKIWKVGKKEEKENQKTIELYSLDDHNAEVIKVDLLEQKDQYMFLTASADHTVRLYHLSKDLKQKPIQIPTMINHRSPILDANFSDDGKYILTVGQDNQLKRWPVGQDKIEEFNKNVAKLKSEVSEKIKKVKGKVLQAQ